jgi:hypothetical protein
LNILKSNTYSKIEQKSDMVWKNQRYRLISQYSVMAPPFNLIFVFARAIDTALSRIVRKKEKGKSRNIEFPKSNNFI